MTANSTFQQVQRTRKDLIASLSKPRQISGKVEAYAAAIRRHRETIFADVLRETRSLQPPVDTRFSALR